MTFLMNVKNAAVHQWWFGPISSQ